MADNSTTPAALQRVSLDDETVADLVGFLASPASSFVGGGTVEITGNPLVYGPGKLASSDWQPIVTERTLTARRPARTALPRGGP